MRICSNCGHETKDNEKFCINCGAILPELGRNSQIPLTYQDQSNVNSANQNNSFQQPESQPYQYNEQYQPQQICSNCGRVAITPSKFCIECGTPIQEVPQSQNYDEGTSPSINQLQQSRLQNEPPQKEKKSLSRGKKIGIISVIALIGLIIGTHFVLQNMFNPKGQLDQITKHFEDKNEKEFMNSFIFPENTYVDAKSFYQFVDDNDWILDDLEDAVIEGEGSVKNPDGSKIIKITSEPFLVLYKKFSFEVIPVEVIAYNNNPNHNLELKVGAHDLVKLNDDEVKVGLFAPGNYEYTLKLNDGYFENELKEEAYLEGNEYSLTFDFSEDAVYLSSDIDEATVFIDGKSTGKTASEIELIAAPLDGSVEIYAETMNDNGEAIQSETLYLTEYDTHIYFAEVQEQYAIVDFYDYYSWDAEDLFYSFRWDYQYAVNTADFSYVEDYFIEGSQLKNDYETFVEDHEDLGFYYYDFISNDIIDSYPLSANSLVVETLETFEFTSDEDGTWHYEREKRYTIEYVDGMLKIANIEDIKDVNKTKIE